MISNVVYPKKLLKENRMKQKYHWVKEWLYVLKQI